MKLTINDLNQQELIILQLMLNSNLIHYSDIEKSIGRSRKTITKYLNHIGLVLEDYDVHIIRKRSIGMYLRGSTTRLTAALFNKGYSDIPVTSQERVVFILSQLLLSDQSQSIQKLADQTFVSRGTLENDFKEVKRTLSEHHATIESTHDGIKLVATESEKRKLISDLLTMYWGNTIYSKNEKGEVDSKLKLPENIQEFFDKDIFDKVLSALNHFETISKLHFTDYEFQSLVIHISIAMERITKNKVLDESETNIQIDRETTALIGILEQEFNVKIPIDEQQYINIHILAVEGQTQGEDRLRDASPSYRQTEVNNFLKRVLHHYDDILLHELSAHLSSTLKRLKLGLNIRNPYTNEVKKNFPQAFNKAIDISSEIEKKFNVAFDKDEVAYVALHIEAYLERKKNMVNVVIVCSSGFGTARLLEQRIKKVFSDSIHISRVTSIQELKHSTITEDLVISTINLDVPGTPVVMVPPFLDPNSINQIQLKVSQVLGSRQNFNSFLRLLNKDLIVVKNGKQDRDDVIRMMGSKLANRKFGKSDIGEAIIRREEMASTAIDNVALPHAQIEYVLKPCIAIYINRDGIQWGSQTVNIVFFLVMNYDIQGEIEEIYKRFNDVLENKVLLQKIVNSNNADEIIHLLGSD